MARPDLRALAATLACGAIGGQVAHWAHLPLGYLLGSLLVVGALAATGRRAFGQTITLPSRLRFSFVPVIGVAIGGAFTPQVVTEALGWGPSLLMLTVFVPVAHAVGYAIYRRGGLAPVEAFFGAIPGGLLESVQLGEDAGADVRLLTVLQFLRLISTIIAVPLIFLLVTGHAVGSASGAQMVGADHSLTLRDAALLTAAGAVGVLVARTLRFPGWIITGPLCASALLHGMGIVQTVPPAWLISVTQIVLGTGLGARFVGIDPALLRRAAGLACVNAVAALSLAFAFAASTAALTQTPLTAAFLAFAPGGLAEMSLIALSLKMSVIYVTAHHVVRILLAVTFAKLAARWLR